MNVRGQTYGLFKESRIFHFDLMFLFFFVMIMKQFYFIANKPYKAIGPRQREYSDSLGCIWWNYTTKVGALNVAHMDPRGGTKGVLIMPMGYKIYIRYMYS